MNRLSNMILGAVLCAGATAAVAGSGGAKATPKPAAAAHAKKPAHHAKATHHAKAAPAADASASADVKVGTGYANHEVVGAASSFPTGTKVYAVSTVTGEKGTMVKHVWKKDGSPIWTASLHIGSSRWTTASIRTLGKAGSYEVDVVGADGSDLGKVEFTIQ